MFPFPAVPPVINPSFTLSYTNSSVSPSGVFEIANSADIEINDIVVVSQFSGDGAYSVLPSADAYLGTGFTKVNTRRSYLSATQVLMQSISYHKVTSGSAFGPGAEIGGFMPAYGQDGFFNTTSYLAVYRPDFAYTTISVPIAVTAGSGSSISNSSTLAIDTTTGGTISVASVIAGANISNFQVWDGGGLSFSSSGAVDTGLYCGRGTTYIDAQAYEQGLPIQVGYTASAGYRAFCAGVLDVY